MWISILRHKEHLLEFQRSTSKYGRLNVIFYSRLLIMLHCGSLKKLSLCLITHHRYMFEMDKTGCVLWNDIPLNFFDIKINISVLFFDYIFYNLYYRNTNSFSGYKNNIKFKINTFCSAFFVSSSVAWSTRTRTGNGLPFREFKILPSLAIVSLMRINYSFSASLLYRIHKYDKFNML